MSKESLQEFSLFFKKFKKKNHQSSVGSALMASMDELVTNFETDPNHPQLEKNYQDIMGRLAALTTINGSHSALMFF